MIEEFPLFVFTTLGGVAAGAYVIAAFFPHSSDKERPWLLPLVALVLLGVSGIALLLHLGRPERMILAFSNPSAGITQEGYATVVFGVVVAIDFLVGLIKGRSLRPVRIVGAIAGFALMLTMGSAYYSYSAQEAWAYWATFPLFIIGDLAIGAALMALFDSKFYQENVKRTSALILSVLFVLSAVFDVLHYIAIGKDVVGFIVGGVLGIVSAVLMYVSKKHDNRAVVIAIFVCMLLAVAFARYTFYAAYGA